MNPPALLHNLNLTPETETVFSSKQVARDITRVRRREAFREKEFERRNRRRWGSCSNWRKNCRDLCCTSNALLLALALVGFFLLILVYFLFEHVIEW
uniref:Uncharacterized protein n=1 Tax=Steinernema glaseri TaxID=37863 RepID=A0A1I7YL91_9BILA